MERKIRKRYKRARASWKRAAAKSEKTTKTETLKRREFAFVAFASAALATSGSVAGIASGAEPPLRPVVTMDDAHRCAFRVVASSNARPRRRSGAERRSRG